MRRPFGGTPDARVEDPRTGAAQPGAQGTVWRLDGITRVTDIQTLDGHPIPGGVLVADEDALVAFFGPDDGTDRLLLDFGYGRFLVEAVDAGSRVADASDATEDVEDQVAEAASEFVGFAATIGQPNGLATLDSTGRVPVSQLPTLPTGARSLTDLADVDVPTPAPRGTALVYDAASGKWRPGYPGHAALVDDPDLWPLIFAARTGQNVHPHNTLEGVAALVAAGMPVDVTCNPTIDGVPVCVVDPLDTHTVLEGSPWQVYSSALKGRVVDCDTWFGATWPRTSVPTLREVLALTRGQVPLAIECQTANAVLQATAEVVRSRREKTVIIQSFTLADLAPAAAAGIPCMLLHTDGVGLDPAALLAAGIQWVGLSTAASTNTVATLLAAGMRVVIWTIDRQVARDEVLAEGVHGMFTREPQYIGLPPSVYRRTNLTFDGQTWPPGFVPGSSAPGRGQFVPPNWWQTPPAAAGGAHWLCGWLSPVPSPTGTYQVQVDIRVDASSDTTSHAGLIVAAPTDASGSLSGYIGFLRVNGQLVLQRLTSGSTSSLGTASTPALSVGSTATLRFTVTPTSVTLERVGSSSVVGNDATHRGGYVSLYATISASNQFSFANITVT
jgi:glycerophosphoryl diester phosphodiesterase